jgi:hypothetical protein
MSYFPPKITKGTGKGSMYSLSWNRKFIFWWHPSTSPPMHYGTWQFISMFTRTYHRTLSSPKWIPSVSSSHIPLMLFHQCQGIKIGFFPLSFQLKCSMHFVSLPYMLQTLHITSSLFWPLIVFGINYKPPSSCYFLCSRSKYSLQYQKMTYRRAVDRVKWSLIPELSIA